ncbi:MAG TPA: hypothetical protein VI685_00130 [Candidatus Angelobacter sp.]
MTETQPQQRIYLNPPRFWAATRNMTEEDANQFTNKIYRLAVEGRVEELRRYDFICFGHKVRPS